MKTVATFAVLFCFFLFAKGQCPSFNSANSDSSPVQVAGETSLPNGYKNIEWTRPYSSSPTSIAAFSGTGGSTAGHEGTDYIHNRQSVATVTIYASAGGQVVYVRIGCAQSSEFSRNTISRECGAGWGNHVVLSHGNSIFTRYAHLKPGSISVKVGDNVAKGQSIGVMGNSGRSEVRHLHFEVGRKSSAFNSCSKSQSFDRVYNSQLLPYGNVINSNPVTSPCPSGATFDTTYTYCTDSTNMFGPFTKAMVQVCINNGGGDGACKGDFSWVTPSGSTVTIQRWAKNFAISIRGNGVCPLGAQQDAEFGNKCVESTVTGKEVYGPFEDDLVRKCVSAGGGGACYTGRWSANFYKALASSIPSKSVVEEQATLAREMGEDYANLTDAADIRDGAAVEEESNSTPFIFASIPLFFIVFLSIAAFL